MFEHNFAPSQIPLVVFLFGRRPSNRLVSASTFSLSLSTNAIFDVLYVDSLVGTSPINV